MDKMRGICRSAIWATTIIWLLASGAGCTRMFYRNQVDGEVDAVLREKDIFPEWKIENMHVYADARARHFDPSKPDRPPMPPDDPAAKLLGPNPQRPRHAGVARVEGTGYLDLLATWDAHNRAKPDMIGALQTVAHLQKEGEKPEKAPPPKKGDAAPVPEQKPFLITVDQAVELGLINSREFQTRREDLYLTALPVTRERFAFAAQFHVVGQYLRENTGLNLTNGSDTGSVYGSGVGVGKLFSTGALLLVAFANQTVVDLTNPTSKTLTSSSTINLDMIQPLLRGGGRAATLEPLTQTERNLLYEIRDYARFRRQYYQYLTGGSGLPSLGVTTPGNLAATHPLVSTLAGANFARQQIAPFTSGSLGALGINGIAPAQGYLPTLLQASQLQYQKDNVKELKKVLELYKAYESGGQVSPLQVGQVELQLFQAKSTVLAAEQDLRDATDSFKLQLGIPVNTPLELDNTMIRPITAQLASYNAIIEDYEDTGKKLDELYDLGKPSMDPANAKKDLGTPEKLRGALESLLKDSSLTKHKNAETFREKAPERWGRWKTQYKDEKAILDALEELGTKRRKLEKESDKLEIDIEKNKAMLEALEKAGAEPGALEKLRKSLQKDDETLLASKERLRVNYEETGAGKLELALRIFERAPWRKEAKDLERSKEYVKHWSKVWNAYVLLLGEASNERFGKVTENWRAAPGVVVNGVDVVKTARDALTEVRKKLADDRKKKVAKESDQAGDIEQFALEPTYALVTQAAYDQRLDLMNSRAQVVDAWRQLRVFANGLLGAFNVAYHMNSSTPPTAATPLAFSPDYTRHQLVMNFDLPIVRLTERNAYRASLIAYQRARRNLQQKEDEIALAVRSEVRQLQVLAENMAIQQKAVELAYKLVESSLETFRAPQAGEGGNAAANAASLTSQLLQAYRSLPQAQSALLATWINYQIARQQLLLDLELLPLDARGVLNEFGHPQPLSHNGANGTNGPLERQPGVGADREGGDAPITRARFGPLP